MNLCEIVNQSAGNVSFPFERNLLRNDVTPDIQANICKHSLEQVIDGLLKHAAVNSTGKEIRIFAKRYNDIVLVQVKYNDGQQKSFVTESLKCLNPIAEELGGCLYITHSSITETTLSFTFSNNGMKISA